MVGYGDVSQVQLFVRNGMHVEYCRDWRSWFIAGGSYLSYRLRIWLFLAQDLHPLLLCYQRRRLWGYLRFINLRLHHLSRFFEDFGARLCGRRDSWYICTCSLIHLIWPSWCSLRFYGHCLSDNFLTTCSVYHLIFYHFDIFFWYNYLILFLL